MYIKQRYTIAEWRLERQDELITPNVIKTGNHMIGHLDSFTTVVYFFSSPDSNTDVYFHNRLYG
uniref:Kinesin motor domain-containing protein n=1 Tax=Heterorhabditis bacteriophora TaxID=37862 RepID=A0A1I7W7T8_HETBA